MRKNVKKDWSHELVAIDEEDETKNVTHKLWGRHASNLDMHVAMRVADPDEIKNLNEKENPVALTAVYLNNLMFTRYKDITMQVMFERCIKSHNVCDDDAVVNIHCMNEKEQDDLFVKIIKPWIIIIGEPVTPTPEQEGQAEAGSFPVGVSGSAGDDSGQDEPATTPAT